MPGRRMSRCTVAFERLCGPVTADAGISDGQAPAVTEGVPPCDLAEPVRMGAVEHGSDIVELPFRWVLDDAPFFQYSIVLPGRTMHAPSSVLESWTTEFDVLHSEDRMMMVAMHPQLIGQPSRLTVLEGLIRYALDFNNVWIGRCDEISDALRPGLQAVAA